MVLNGRLPRLCAQVRLKAAPPVERYAPKEHQKIVLSGIQPTGSPHLGNYFGFIRPWLDLQKSTSESTPLFLSVVNQHALSLGPVLPAGKLKNNTWIMAASLLACGVDPTRTVLFRQSDILEISQMNWILSSLQTVKKLQRLPQYKDKASKFSNGVIPVGLLIYPVLQSADVFTFKGTHIPVGEDQTQHMMLMRDLAIAFNSEYGIDHFPVAEQVVPCEKAHARIKSLRDPEAKMSKSDPSGKGRIDIGDDVKLVQQKCMKALSNTYEKLDYDRVGLPAVANLLDIYSAVSGKPVEEIVATGRDWDVVQLKTNLAQATNELLGPIHERLEYYKKNPKEVEDILQDNATRARAVAAEVLGATKDIVGLH
ncbi:unnamed protein product, partial [Mesorhabditis spiculigera]